MPALRKAAIKTKARGSRAYNKNPGGRERKTRGEEIPENGVNRVKLTASQNSSLPNANTLSISKGAFGDHEKANVFIMAFRM